MTSRKAAALAGAAAPALAALACGQGVHDLGVAGQPLVTLHGHVDRAALARVDASAPLLGALIWAAVPAVNPVCVQFAGSASFSMIQPACPDPAGVLLGALQAVGPVDADGNFDLPILHLPAVRVSVGDASTRIAYGSVMVVEDVNGDGQPTLVTSAVRLGRRFGPPPPPPMPDNIVAATFYDLHSDQQRVVFREGGFVPYCTTAPPTTASPCSYFYPALGCSEPPMPGFWIMNAPAAGGCSYAAPDTLLEIPPLDQATGTAFYCRALQRDGTVRQPVGDEEPTGDYARPCLAPGVMAVLYNRNPCKVLRSYALAACQQDALCAAPEWNIDPTTISWWPSTCR